MISRGHQRSGGFVRMLVLAAPFVIVLATVILTLCIVC